MTDWIEKLADRISEAFGEPNPYRTPPLVLPTEPSVIRAVVNGRADVLLTGPHPADTERGSGPVTWDEFDNHFHYPDEISSFEVLWTEDA